MKKILLILFLIGLITLTAFGLSGTYTTSDYFYMPGYGSYGTDEFDEYETYMQVADTQIESNKTEASKNKWDATTAPTVNNDVDEGYLVGSTWADITNDKAYVCLDKTDGAAVWKIIAPAGSGSIGISGTPLDDDWARWVSAVDIEGLSNAELIAALSLEAGVDIQAYDAGLLSIAGLTTSANDMIYTTALDTYAIMDTFAEIQAVVADKTLVNEEDVCTIDANWVNTANPWADNEVADALTVTGYMQDEDINTFSELDTWVTDKTLVNTTNKLSAFAATTSAELAGVISDETGTGALVFGTLPTLSDVVVTDRILFDNTNTTTKIGYQAGKNIVSGAIRNVFIGYQAGLSNDGGSTDAADYNVGVGYQVLLSNTTGKNNNAVGTSSLDANTTGDYNNAMGAFSLTSNTEGNNNNAMGMGALLYNTEGDANVAVGDNASSANTLGDKNTAVGTSASYSNTTGSNNVAIGWSAGRFWADGTTALVTPENSVYIGWKAMGKNDDDSNSIVIGFEAIGMGADTTVIGNSSITDTYLSGNIHAVSSAYIQTVVTMDDGDATPDVQAGNVFISQSNTGATEITDLDNPTVGQIVTIIVGNATNPPTMTDGGNFALSAAWSPDLDDVITLFVQADNDYIEISRSTN